LPKPKRLMLRKDHHLLDEINRVIREDMIYIIRLYNKYYTYVRPSKCEQRRIKGPKPLGLTPFYGVLTILLVGLMIGTSVFVVELICFKKFNK
jgi:hypothetical protein